MKYLRFFHVLRYVNFEYYSTLNERPKKMTRVFRKIIYIALLAMVSITNVNGAATTDSDGPAESADVVNRTYKDIMPLIQQGGGDLKKLNSLEERFKVAKDFQSRRDCLINGGAGALLFAKKYYGQDFNQESYMRSELSMVHRDIVHLLDLLGQGACCMPFFGLYKELKHPRETDNFEMLERNEQEILNALYDRYLYLSSARARHIADSLCFFSTGDLQRETQRRMAAHATSGSSAAT
jgi:hypothetical protein